MRPARTCVDCGASFVPPGHTGRPPERCGECGTKRRRNASRQRQQAWRLANPERTKEHQDRYAVKRRADPNYREYHRKQSVKSKRGISWDELQAMIAAQDGKCAICGGQPNGPGTRLHIDHCHDTNRIRGLLCGKCNTAIGLLDDVPERAEALAAYLRR